MILMKVPRKYKDLVKKFGMTLVILIKVGGLRER
jgi:hypothetical protein